MFFSPPCQFWKGFQSESPVLSLAYRSLISPTYSRAQSRCGVAPVHARTGSGIDVTAHGQRLEGLESVANKEGGADASARSGNGESVCVKQGSQTGVNKPPRAFPRARDRESGHSRCAEFRRRPALGRPAHVRALIVSARHVAVCHDTPGEGERIAGTEPSRFPARIAASSPQASTAGTALSPPTANPRVYSESERTHAVGPAAYGDGLSSKKQEPSHVCQGEPCLG